MPIITVFIPDYIAADPGHPSHQSVVAQLVIDALAERGDRVDNAAPDHHHDDSIAPSSCYCSHNDDYRDPWFTDPCATAITPDYNNSTSPASPR